MKFLVCITLLFCVFLSVTAQPASQAIVLPGARAAALKISVINNREYFSFAEIGKVIFPGSALTGNGTELVLKDRTIRCGASNFFLASESPQKSLMAQMPLPALRIGRQIYVPAPAFLRMLETLELFYVQESGGKFYLKNFLEPVHVETKEAIAGSEPLKSSRPQKNTGIREERGIKEELPETESLISDKVRDVSPHISPILKNFSNGWLKTKELATETVKVPPVRKSPPNYYLIPSDLRRRELENTPRPRPTEKGPGRTVPQSGEDESSSFTKYESPLLASLDFNPGPAAQERFPELQQVFAVKGEGSFELHFQAADTIRNFQKPEKNGRQIIFRIPNFSFDRKNLAGMDDIPGLHSVRFEQVRNFAVFRILLKGEASLVSTARNGFRELILKIVPEKEEIAAEEEIVTEENDPSKKKWSLDCIVLDPGHGGHDVGAQSLSGKYEKDITLSIARRVEKLIGKHMPGTRVVMTRNDDRFIELYRRGKIANEEGGKLFISIHCNSMPKKPHPAHGFETYILRPGRNADATRVADRENSVIKLERNQQVYKKLTEEELIVATMAQSSFVKFSELFATNLQKEVGRSTPLFSRGVNQAGFLVLVGASMPNVLFETAFLSNEDDEKFICSESGQDRIAQGIFNAIRKYSGEYRKSLGSR